MSVNLRIKLAKASGLIQALRILQDEPGASGSLRIKDGRTVGTLAFAKGRITGAALSASGERGEAALEKLARLKMCHCNYSKRQKTFLTETPLDIAFENFIEHITSLTDVGDEALVDESSPRVSEVDPDEHALTNQKETPVTSSVINHELVPKRRNESAVVASAVHSSPIVKSAVPPVLKETPAESPAAETVETTKITNVALPVEANVHSALSEAPGEPVNGNEAVGNRRRSRPPGAMIFSALGAFRHFPLAELLGILCLGALAVGIVVVPAKIKGSVGGLAAEQQARESLKQAINNDLLADESQQSAEMAPRKAPRKPLTDLPPDGIEILNEDLRAGRVLMSRNKPAPAIPYFESYLRLYPDNIKVRTELIDAYIADNNNHSARLLCIRTLKRNLNSAQMTTIWQHFQRCQTN